MEKIPVIGIPISLTSYGDSTREIISWAKMAQNRYVCAANVHMLMEAHDSPEFNKIVNSADLVTPDGMPLVWMMRLKGIKDQERVYGPTLMLHCLETATRDKIPVGFYGSSSEVLILLVDKMKDRYPGLQVAYSYSPPFRELFAAEDQDICQQIQNSGARILFVGLGCPKQEFWMANHRDRVNVVMVGVGAAFDFHAGVKPQSPAWLQAVGLEWLFRLFHEPRRLAKRYLYNNPRFVLLAIMDIMGILKRGK